MVLQVFWIVCFVANLIICCNIEIFLTNKEELLGNINMFFTFISLRYYFLSFSSVFCFILISLISNVKQRKKVLILKDICEGIISFNLNSLSLTKIATKSEKRLTEFENYCKKIVNSFKEIKSFIPESVLVGEDDVSTCVSNDLNKNNDSENSTIETSIPSCDTITYEKPKQCSQFEIYIKNNGNISILKCWIQNLDDIFEMNSIKGTQSKEIINLISKHVEVVGRIVKSNNGVMHSYDGNNLICSFNTVLKCVNHAENACSAALMINKSEKLSENFDLPELEIKIEIITDSSINFGNLGSSKFKRFCFIGKNYNKLNALESINSQLNTRILVDENTQRLVRHDYNLKLVDFIKNAKKFFISKVFELVNKKGENSRGSFKNEINEKFELILENIRKEKYENAERCLKNIDYLDLKGNNKFFARIVKKIKKKKVYSCKF